MLAQRLVRKLCPGCSEETAPTSATVKAAAALGHEIIRVFTGAGCGKCRQSRYAGRIGLFEMLVQNDELRDAVTAGATLNQLRLARQAGMRTLLEDGFAKAHDGKTTVEEVLCVTAG